MLKNGTDGILKNSDGSGGETIFKSQVINSYICTTSNGSLYTCMTLSGMEAGDCVSIFYASPTVCTCKISCTVDGTHTLYYYNSLGESSVKKIYFCGNLENVTSVTLRRQCTTGCYQGDMMCFMTQFPSLIRMDFSLTETDFNQSISNCTVPATLRYISQYDRGVQGDWSTVINSNCIDCWKLCYTSYSGEFCDINHDNLTYLHLYYTPAPFQIYLPYLTAQSSLIDTCFFYPYGAYGDAADVDPSNITNCFFWNMLTANNFTGNVSGWTFNTGLTGSFQLGACTEGDISNWNISETKLNSGLAICNTNYFTPPHMGGSLSGWTIPTGVTSLSLHYLFCLTDVPSDYSAVNNLTSMYFNYLPALSGNVDTWLFPDNNMNSFSVSCTALCGCVPYIIDNLLPTGLTYLQLNYSCFTGNLADINIPQNTYQFLLEGNNITGNVSDLDLTNKNSLLYLELDNNPTMCWDLNTPYNTCNLIRLSLNNISGVTGSFNNLTVGSSLIQLCMYSTCCITADINELPLNNNISTLNIASSNVSQDVTAAFSGTNNLDCLCIHSNFNLSADTSYWNVPNLTFFVAYNTKICGRLCLACPYCAVFYSSCVQSCIEEDFDLSVRALYFCGFNNCMTGHLSGVSFNFSCICRFSVQGNTAISGTNEFTNYVFVNRKNFTRNPTCLNICNLADTVTGISEVLGDLGTYGGDPSGMDLSETQVNNLVCGLDYNGLGSNIPWDSKQKIYWFKNACCSSATTTKRYVGFCYYYT